LQCLLAVLGGENLDASIFELLQRLLNQQADVGFVVYDQNAGHAPSPKENAARNA